MNTRNNAALKAVKAEPCLNLDELALDVHALYKQQAGCGYDRDLGLSAFEVQGIAARLRGIRAISALFIAAGDSDALKLGGWIDGGLNDALQALAEDAHSILEQHNNRVQKGGAA